MESLLSNCLKHAGDKPLHVILLVLAPAKYRDKYQCSTLCISTSYNRNSGSSSYSHAHPADISIENSCQL